MRAVHHQVQGFIFLMRYLATLAHEPAARKFGDYLLVLGIHHQLEAGEKGWELWIQSEDDLERAQRELSEFEQNPDASRYGQAARSAGKLRASAEKQAHKRRKNFIDVRTSWAGLPAQSGFPLTIALILLSVMATLAIQTSNAPGGPPNPVLNHLFIAPIGNFRNFASAWSFIRQGQIGELLQIRWEGLAVVRHGQVWRLVTPIFLHFGFLHLLFDMWWLYDLGRAIETRKGTWKLLGIVLLGGILGNLAQYLWSGPLGGGMSGVVYALFGYIWIKGLLSPREGLAVATNTVWLMLGWLVLCMTGLLGPIGNGAHLIGLITGVILAAIPYRWQKLRRMRAR
jgi:GlpG protein